MRCCWWRWKAHTPCRTPTPPSISIWASLARSSSRQISHPWTTTSWSRPGSRAPCCQPPPSSTIMEFDSEWPETESARFISLWSREHHKNHQARELCTCHQWQAKIRCQQRLLHPS
ncbi:hypothetical protein GW17_00023851 [Ensete ventricosum]|nr:hypothetical protein GW17_00023851 [Ensete ventricosum]